MEVVVQGLSEDLESLNGSDLGASVNLADLGPGMHSAVVEFEPDAAFTIVSSSELQIDVVQSADVLEAGTSSSRPQESESDSSEKKPQRQKQRHRRRPEKKKAAPADGKEG